MALFRDFPPRLLPSSLAAHYLGVSESLLQTLPIPRRKLKRKRVFDRHDLDRYADSLPYEAQEASGCDAADQVWGEN